MAPEEEARMADRSEEARLRAESNFKKKHERAKEGEKAWADHLAAGKAADTNRAKLKALRLARDATEKPVAKAAKGKKPKGRAAVTPGATAMETLVKETKEREVLPTHRQVPTKAPRAARKKIDRAPEGEELP
jgi:hypothetical protein